jgi:hypothetical protein
MDKPKKYDGIYFLPGDEENQMKFAFFDLNDESYSHDPIENTEIGDKFHIAFFKQDEDGLVSFDEHFEAIFSDPMTYLQGFIGMNLYGCMVRKTETSTNWFNNYLEKTKKIANDFKAMNEQSA